MLIIYRIEKSHYLKKRASEKMQMCTYQIRGPTQVCVVDTLEGNHWDKALNEDRIFVSTSALISMMGIRQVKFPQLAVNLKEWVCRVCQLILPPKILEERLPAGSVENMVSPQ